MHFTSQSRIPREFSVVTGSPRSINMIFILISVLSVTLDVCYCIGHGNYAGQNFVIKIWGLTLLVIWLIIVFVYCLYYASTIPWGLRRVACWKSLSSSIVNQAEPFLCSVWEQLISSFFFATNSLLCKMKNAVKCGVSVNVAWQWWNVWRQKRWM